MRGYIRKRGRSWAITVELERGTDGKRRQRFESVTGTKKTAEARLSALISEIENGGFVEPSKLTVGEYLGRWLEHVEHSVTGKTHARYVAICTRHLIPALGKLGLSKLQPLHIQTHYSEALREGRLDGKGALSSTTVLQHFKNRAPD